MSAKLLDIPRVFLSLLLLSSVLSAPANATASAQLSDADSMPIRIVTAGFVQQQYPQPRLQQLAFSPDATQLAFTTREPTSEMVDNSPLFADTLKLLTMQANRPIETLVDTDVTLRFAFYGAPIFSLQWQQDRVSFYVGNGDDEAHQLQYLLQEHRLADPQGQYASDEIELLPSTTAQALKLCFPDLPAGAVPQRPDQLIAQAGSDFVFFQPSYSGVPANIWLVKLNGCLRQSLALPLPTNQLQLMHAVVNSNRLTLVLSQTQAQHRKTLLWQTNLDDVLQHKPLLWQDFSYGLPKGINRVTPLGSAQQQQLLLLHNYLGDCRKQLISVGPKGLQQIQVDGQRLCNAAVHANGQLALALSPQPSAANANGDAAEAEQLWLVKPEFLAALQH